MLEKPSRTSHLLILLKLYDIGMSQSACLPTLHVRRGRSRSGRTGPGGPGIGRGSCRKSPSYRTPTTSGQCKQYEVMSPATLLL